MRPVPCCNVPWYTHIQKRPVPEKLPVNPPWNAQTEDDRLKKALLRCQLLDAAKLDFSSLMRHFHKLVVPLMVYGWCSKKPTQRDSDRVFNKLTLASHTCRMANNKTRKTICDGGLHLEAGALTSSERLRVSVAVGSFPGTTVLVLVLGYFVDG